MDLRSGSADLLVRLLGACEQRARVVSANIANSNTPGYVRQLVRFEEVLGAALRSGQDASDIAPEVVRDVESPSRPDGNNVSLELELNALRENRLLYEAYSSILRSQFALVESAITESR